MEQEPRIASIGPAARPPGSLGARYFGSGWAFLLPYLALYGLYAWRGWPINWNPDSAARALPLVQAYWVLHACHLVFALRAFRIYWLNNDGGTLALAVRVMPWVCLMLIFAIPGPYLEFPSDPWEHLRRINEWQSVERVTAHSAWQKSSYLLAYSFTRPFFQLQRLALDTYYTAACLLLAYQYYRLARTVGLSRTVGLTAVALHALIAGNSVFSFHRYYGLSSTIIAQAMALALITLAVRKAQELRTDPLAVTNVLGWARTLFAAAVLAVLITFSHRQGLVIAAVGCAAVALWYFLENGRRNWLWLSLALAGGSVAVLLFMHRHPTVESQFRPAGWLTRWYAFNIWSPGSPAYDRTVQIASAFEIPGLVASIWLVSRRHVAGWLGLTPYLLISLPLVGLPVANELAAKGAPYIITFHRIFFAVPTSIVLCAAAAALWRKYGTEAESSAPRLAYGVLMLALVLVTCLPVGRSGYNRTWHALSRAPQDLELRNTWDALRTFGASSRFPRDGKIGAPSGLGFVASATRPLPTECWGRTYFSEKCVPSIDLNLLHRVAEFPHPANTVIFLAVNPDGATTAGSQAARLSGHWLPYECALVFAGSRQLAELGTSLGLASHHEPAFSAFFQPGK